MPVSLKKGQKVSLTKGNPGLKNVVVGIGWDINAFDTGGDFDLDAAAFCLTDSGRVSDSNDFVFYGNLVHPSGAVQHMGDNLTGAGEEMMSRLRSICQRFLPISQRLHLQLPSMMQRQDARISDRFPMPL